MQFSDIQKLTESLALAGAARFDRSAHLRGDADAMANLRADPSAAVVLLWQNKPLVHTDGPLRLVRAPLKVLEDAPHGPLIFLGLAPMPVFAAELTAFQPDLADSAAVGGLFDQTIQPFPPIADAGFVDLRSVLTQMPDQDMQLAATACGLIGWHRSHGYCAACGTASHPADAGWQRRCPDCHRTHFPRTDPVVIMLIYDGDSVLLARSLGWPDGLWSLPAGFVEPGEGIEAAVRREIFEETGIHVSTVFPLISQSWPFPASLMIGCMARALSREITIDCTEIDAAEWVSRQEMRRVLDGHGTLRLPPRHGAIARHMLENWVNGHLAPIE